MGVHKRQNAGNVYKRAVAVGNSWLSKGESVLVTIWRGHGEAPTYDISEEEMVGFRQAFAVLDSVRIARIAARVIVLFRTPADPYLQRNWELQCAFSARIPRNKSCWK